MREREGRLDGWLFAVCVARTCMASIFMTYAATLPVLRTEWEMSATAAGAISTAFQLAYGISLLVFSAVADRVGARNVFLGSAWTGAVAAVAFALFARSYVAGLVLYTLVALSQGGTYTTAIMLFADRYRPARRGAAVGWLIASSSAGYALSLVLAGVALRAGGYPLAFLVSAAGPVLGVLLAWLALRGTPNVVHPPREGLRFVTAVLRNRPAMRLTLGYTFHSWELLGMWAWAPAFLAASIATAGSGEGRAVELGAYVSAVFHIMGLVASFSMGSLSDRLGRRTVLFTLASMSAACSFLFGWMIGGPLLLIGIVGAIYGFTALGDSPVLSTALTEAVNPRYLGAALALRSLLGFGAGAIAPLVVGAVLDATNAPGATPTQWGWAFVTLGVGGAAAAVCAFGLGRDRVRSASPSAERV